MILFQPRLTLHPVGAYFASQFSSQKLMDLKMRFDSGNQWTHLSVLFCLWEQKEEHFTFIKTCCTCFLALLLCQLDDVSRCWEVVWCLELLLCQNLTETLPEMDIRVNSQQVFICGWLDLQRRGSSFSNLTCITCSFLKYFKPSFPLIFKIVA